ncbi:MAG: YjfB family protein [Lachnospiraceae bacterium]|nr:YjfB family protein [Lachnospiraceae bacterium]
MGMSILPLSSTNISVSGTETMTPIDTKILAKTLDTLEQSGDAMIKMMEQSVNPNIGANFDMRV